jgi:hypothetical protein
MFKVPDRTAGMLRVDLAAAGIPYKDARGRVFDFHAQRRHFISDVVRTTRSVKTA